MPTARSQTEEIRFPILLASKQRSRSSRPDTGSRSLRHELDSAFRWEQSGQATFLSTSSFHLERVGPVDASYSQVQIDLQPSSTSLVLQKVFDDSLTDELKRIGSLTTVRPHAPASLSRLPQDRDAKLQSESEVIRHQRESKHLNWVPRFC